MFYKPFPRSRDATFPTTKTNKTTIWYDSAYIDARVKARTHGFGVNISSAG